MFSFNGLGLDFSLFATSFQSMVLVAPRPFHADSNSNFRRETETCMQLMKLCDVQIIPTLLFCKSMMKPLLILTRGIARSPLVNTIPWCTNTKVFFVSVPHESKNAPRASFFVLKEHIVVDFPVCHARP